MAYIQDIPSPIGSLRVWIHDDTVTRLDLPHHMQDEAPKSTPSNGDMRLFHLCVNELNAYFSGRLQTFTLPLAPQGTPFQLRVWEQLKQIPYGQTLTYGELAARIGSPRGARAVGMACHSNPIPILIPCHRVVGKNGSLTGFAGGLELKEKLLLLEKNGIIP